MAIISDSTKGSTYSLPILGETIDFTPHKAWVFPLLASLRPALDKSKKPFKWKAEPFKLFDRLAPELMSKVNRSYNSLQNFNAVGRNPDLYELLMEKVENALQSDGCLCSDGKKGRDYVSKDLKPGEKAPVSGLYELIGPRGGHTRKERTVARGEILPPTPQPGMEYRISERAKNKSGHNPKR